MSRKNLQHITLKSTEKPAKKNQNKSDFSSENSTIQSTFSEVDLEDLHHLDFAAGISPYLRGISSTMYVTSTWNINQSAQFYSSEAYNAFYIRQFKAGQRSFYLDLDWKQNEKFNIETLEHFKGIFKHISLEEISISLSDNAISLPLLAFYIVTAETQNLNLEQLKGNFNVDVLTDLNIQNRAKNSERITSDILAYAKTNLPKFNSISISGDTLHTITSNPETQLALMLICGNKQLKEGLASGLKIDDITPRLSFNFELGLQHFTEIAKLRAARMLWAKIVKSHHPKNEKSLALHIHSRTISNGFSNSDLCHSVTKTTIEAAAAAFGGSQSLQTQSLYTSTSESERLDRNIQLYLKEETQITKTVDPWAGSFYVEKRTSDFAEKTWELFEAYETLGKLPDSIQTTLYQLNVNTSNLNKSEDKNSFQPLQETPLNRDEDAITNALLRLKKATHNSNENLLTLAIEAVRNHATLSEIYNALN
ncbi:methylmalonyl-CoA mutase family protein [Formosa sp. PL04]|uniref:methylmalonyl-CoA mutase family protein n=1 Tax=Formosa sp. PL04 TaxID=3081755 RepID=UPI002981582A|nr:methylmalonyl-CoA mutase family protein [Formosa sp. PL04]MDW5289720.1 methylmalonyl-CoA mutase family protein [Formosa sp. PL04]